MAQSIIFSIRTNVPLSREKVRKRERESESESESESERERERKTISQSLNITVIQRILHHYYILEKNNNAF